MDRHKIFRSVLLCLLAVALVLTCMPRTEAETSAEAKQRLEALEEQKAEMDEAISALRGKLSDNLSQIEDIVAQKSLIDQEIFLMHQKIGNMNDQISAYSVLIADKQEELEQAQAYLEQLRAQNKERIRAMEKNGRISYWSVLFKANSFIDLLDRLKMIRELAEADQQRLAELSRAADAVAEAKESLEGEKQSLEDAKDALRTTQNDLELKRQEANSLLSGLVAKGAEFEALIDESEEKQEALAEKIAKAEDDYQTAKDKETEANKPKPKPPVNNTGSGNGGGSGGNTQSGASWKMPINYTYYSSPFGMRWHPIHNEYRMHNGVDLAAPEGTPIYATRSGYVSCAAYEEGGAGYYVQLNHGDGYKSIYMHMTHYIVYTGQYVEAGQVIGYCGSTGGSTGPHLHFGISYNGTYVNPADYINI